MGPFTTSRLSYWGMVGHSLRRALVWGGGWRRIAAPKPRLPKLTAIPGGIRANGVDYTFEGGRIVERPTPEPATVPPSHMFSHTAAKKVMCSTVKDSLTTQRYGFLATRRSVRPAAVSRAGGLRGGAARGDRKGRL